MLMVLEEGDYYYYYWVDPAGEVIISGSTIREDTDLGYYLLFGSQDNPFAEIYIDAVTMVSYKEQIVFREGFEKPLSSISGTLVNVERVCMPT